MISVQYFQAENLADRGANNIYKENTRATASASPVKIFVSKCRASVRTTPILAWITSDTDTTCSECWIQRVWTQQRAGSGTILGTSAHIDGLERASTNRYIEHADLRHQESNINIGCNDDLAGWFDSHQRAYTSTLFFHNLICLSLRNESKTARSNSLFFRYSNFNLNLSGVRRRLDHG